MTARCGREVTSLWDVGPSFRASLSSLTLLSLRPAGTEVLPSPSFQGKAQTWAASVQLGPRPRCPQPPLCPQGRLQQSCRLGENLIGLSRARRPHNAIFVNFEGDRCPSGRWRAAVQTWKKVCTNPVTRVEAELRKVRPPPRPPRSPAGPRACLRLPH